MLRRQAMHRLGDRRDRGAAGYGLRRHARRGSQRTAPAPHDGAEQSGRRLRPHGAYRREDHGRRRHHRARRGVQRHRRRRHRGDGPADERKGQRRPHDDDGARCCRRHLHQRVQGTRVGRDGAGEDDRGSGSHLCSGRFAVQDGAGLRRGVEGRSVEGHHRRRFVTGRARPPISDGNGQGRRRRPEGGQLRLLRRRRRSADRAARQEDHGRHVESRANSSTRSRPASCGCSRCPATSGSRASMPRH